VQNHFFSVHAGSRSLSAFASSRCLLGLLALLVLSFVACSDDSGGNNDVGDMLGDQLDLDADTSDMPDSGDTVDTDAVDASDGTDSSDQGDTVDTSDVGDANDMADMDNCTGGTLCGMPATCCPA